VPVKLVIDLSINRPAYFALDAAHHGVENLSLVLMAGQRAGFGKIASGEPGGGDREGEDQRDDSSANSQFRRSQWRARGSGGFHARPASAREEEAAKRQAAAGADF